MYREIAEKMVTESIEKKLMEMGAHSATLPDAIHEKQVKLMEAKIEEAKVLFIKTYEDIRNLINNYMDISPDSCKIVALWILGTYFHKSWNTYPFLFINAMKGSAKTRLERIISSLQRNGDGNLDNSLSEAVLFRTAQIRGLIIDEFESVGSKEKQVLRELLNAAYKKGGVVRRMKKVNDKAGERMEAESFSLYTPIVMANIWGIEEVLEDRSLSIILEKSNNPAKIKKIEDFDTNQEFIRIKRTLDQIQCSLCSVVTAKVGVEGWNNYIDSRYTTLTTYTHLLHTTTQTTQIIEDELYLKIDETGINGRNLELWMPLFALSAMLPEEELLDTFRIAKERTKEKRVEEMSDSKDLNLYEFISKLEHHRFTPIKIQELTSAFKEFLGIGGDDEDKWLNHKWMGRALKRLNLTTSKRRVARGIEVTLNIEKAKDKFQVYEKEKASYENS